MTIYVLWGMLDRNLQQEKLSPQNKRRVDGHKSIAGIQFITLKGGRGVGSDQICKETLNRVHAPTTKRRPFIVYYCLLEQVLNLNITFIDHYHNFL